MVTWEGEISVQWLALTAKGLRFYPSYVLQELLCGSPILECINEIKKT